MPWFSDQQWRCAFAKIAETLSPFNGMLRPFEHLVQVKNIFLGGERRERGCHGYEGLEFRSLVIGVSRCIISR